jgi:galactose mutarotase-like enzyme
MLKLDKEIHNPAEMISQMRDTTNQMEDYYYGGWQEVMPNSAAGLYRNASLGQHGEIWMIPWKHAILENSPEQVVLKCWTRPLRIPLLIEKTLTLKNNSTTLSIVEKLTNEGGTDLDIMWGHHIAFGLPFLKNGGFIKTNAKKIIAEKNMPDHRLFTPDIEHAWPKIMSSDGKLMDASIIPLENAKPYSDLAYLSDFDTQAFYTIYNDKQDLGFSVTWHAHIFKYLWYWQERYATQEAPWWGKGYAIALEPWTTKHPADPEAAVANGEYLLISAGNSIHSSIEATVIDYKLN